MKSDGIEMGRREKKVMLYTQEINMGALELIGNAVLFFGVTFIWFTGLIGMIRTESIKRKYSGVLSSGWMLLRCINAIMIISSVGTILKNIGLIVEGYSIQLRAGNILGYIFTIVLTVVIIRFDKRRFFDVCDKKLALSVAWNEFMLAASILTRISLIFTIFSMSALWALTDTSEYVRGKDGRIYRIRDDLDL